jgi:alpha/beta hydrolase family protein
MRAAVVSGTAFEHVVFEQARRPSRALHVYIDGDGTPWSGWRPATDPTPRNPLLLGLMALDPNPSVYLGRPCYHGLSQAPPCSSVFWTSQRYSEAVVSSMAAALRRVLQAGGFERVVWFGYSGGGTVAMLLAPRFGETTQLVTIAANLDIDAWADLHGYARLVGSLNPARQAPLPARIRQRHYVGGQDRVVPRDVVVRGPIDPDTVVVIPSYDHTCCWETLWPAVLAEVDQARSGR